MSEKGVYKAIQKLDSWAVSYLVHPYSSGKMVARFRLPDAKERATQLADQLNKADPRYIVVSSYSDSKVLVEDSHRARARGVAAFDTGDSELNNRLARELADELNKKEDVLKGLQDVIDHQVAELSDLHEIPPALLQKENESKGVTPRYVAVPSGYGGVVVEDYRTGREHSVAAFHTRNPAVGIQLARGLVDKLNSGEVEDE